MKKVYSILILGFLMFTGLLAQTQETILTPSKDNSIYQEGVTVDSVQMILVPTLKIREEREPRLQMVMPPGP